MIDLPKNWRELQQAMLLGATDALKITVAPFAEQVWTVADHTHSIKDGGDDVAVWAGSEQDARLKLVHVIMQEHHNCQCDTCTYTRTHKEFPKAAKLVRIR